jgi:hypothetical protein
MLYYCIHALNGSARTKEIKMQINAKWIEYNRVMNEGGEGFNPHPKFIAAPARSAAAPARMIAGKLRTQADALKFAKNCLHGAQKESFLAEVAAKFGA